MFASCRTKSRAYYGPIHCLSLRREYRAPHGNPPRILTPLFGDQKMKPRTDGLRPAIVRIFNSGPFERSYIVAYLITHFWPGATDAQYRATLAVVHPANGLPAGQRYHAAGPAAGGYLIAAVWDSEQAYHDFVEKTLMPKLPTINGGFTGQPEERACAVSNEVTA